MHLDVVASLKNINKNELQEKTSLQEFKISSLRIVYILRNAAVGRGEVDVGTERRKE